MIISIPDIDTQMKIIKQIGKIKYLKDRISGTKLQMKEFEKLYYTVIFDGM